MFPKCFCLINALRERLEIPADPRLNDKVGQGTGRNSRGKISLDIKINNRKNRLTFMRRLLKSSIEK